MTIYGFCTRRFGNSLLAASAFMAMNPAWAAEDFTFSAKLYAGDCSFDMRDSQGQPLPSAEYYTLNYKQDSPESDNTYYCPIYDIPANSRLAELKTEIHDQKLIDMGMVLLDAYVKPIHADPGGLDKAGIFAQCPVTAQGNSVTCAYEWLNLLPHPEEHPSYSSINFKRGEILHGELRFAKAHFDSSQAPPRIRIIGCDAEDETEFPCHDVN
ncbi:hypothetical protein [Dyella flagellata]|uniref:Uncharacterized protein n=1 Tax=Dyella flagellata TaxID=1867833 RepID=A0ABQ5XG88_9GAMM|nr:hypothetical protein [Dyella flagellata]GLQ90715.1 hypothetical protein GCM10007898_42910 [Dyella flagellata]